MLSKIGCGNGKKNSETQDIFKPQASCLIFLSQMSHDNLHTNNLILPPDEADITGKGFVCVNLVDDIFHDSHYISVIYSLKCVRLTKYLKKNKSCTHQWKITLECLHNEKNPFFTKPNILKSEQFTITFKVLVEQIVRCQIYNIFEKVHHASVRNYS